MSTSPFTPSPTDAAVDLLRSVFGSVVDQVISGNAAAVVHQSNMLSEAFRYLNSGVMFFGTIIITYVTLFAVINTANDGEALGKRWSTLYTPLRTLVSAAMVIPTASGYAGIQLFVLLIASWSIGFASNMWGAALEQVAKTSVVEQAMKSVTEDASFDVLAVNALRMQVCAKGINKTVSEIMPSNPTNLVLSTSEKITGTLEKQTKTTTIFYKDKTWSGSENLCGRILLTTVADEPNTNSATTATVERSVKRAIENVRFNYTMSLFNGELLKIVDEVMLAADTPGASISASNINNRVTVIRNGMLKQIREDVKIQVDSDNSGVVAKLKEKGWIYAGSLSSELARMKDAVKSATNSKSQFVEGNADLEQQLSGNVLQAVVIAKTKYDALGSAVAAGVLDIPQAITAKANLPKIQTSFTAADFSSGGASLQSTFVSYFNQIGDTFVSGIVNHLNVENQDPVMQVKDVGDFVSNSAQAVVVVKTAAFVSLKGILIGAQSSALPGMAAVAGITGTVLAALSELWESVAPATYGLMYIGYFLGIWVPMIPFYIFALGVVGWLVFVVEMMAASVLWMAAHTTPAREDSFIGSQTQGYLLLMSGFFRPALMVLGLIASIAVLSPAVSFINAAFMLSFRSLQADSVTGLVSIAGYLLLYAFIIFSVFMLCFSIPQTLPDRILKWIGGGIGDMGEQNSSAKVEQGASSQSRMAAMKMIKGAEKTIENKTKKDDGDEPKKSDKLEGQGGQSGVTA